MLNTKIEGFRLGLGAGKRCPLAEPAAVPFLSERQGQTPLVVCCLPQPRIFPALGCLRYRSQLPQRLMRFFWEISRRERRFVRHCESPPVNQSARVHRYAAMSFATK